MPELGYQFPKPRYRGRAGQIVTIGHLQLAQAVIYLAVLVDQGAPGNFGGVGGQDKIDGQGVDDVFNSLLLVLTHQGFKGIFQTGGCGKATGSIRSDRVVLFGDVGEVEEMTESLRHIQNLLVVQVLQ